jgi:hypothetical protein
MCRSAVRASRGRSRLSMHPVSSRPSDVNVLIELFEVLLLDSGDALHYFGGVDRRLRSGEWVGCFQRSDLTYGQNLRLLIQHETFL